MPKQTHWYAPLVLDTNDQAHQNLGALRHSPRIRVIRCKDPESPSDRNRQNFNDMHRFFLKRLKSSAWSIWSRDKGCFQVSIFHEVYFWYLTKIYLTYSNAMNFRSFTMHCKIVKSSIFFGLQIWIYVHCMVSIFMKNHNLKLQRDFFETEFLIRAGNCKKIISPISLKFLHIIQHINCCRQDHGNLSF